MKIAASYYRLEAISKLNQRLAEQDMDPTEQQSNADRKRPLASK
jgi:hypothetical protein